MTPSKACLDLIKHYESCRLRAYPDPGTNGVPYTIGWGSTGPDIHAGMTWTQAQCDERFARDVGWLGARIAALLGTHPTTQGQFDAMISLAYNIGFSAFKNSTLLRDHLAGHYGLAAAEFGRWTRGGGRILPGLVTRRTAEARLYRGEND